MGEKNISESIDEQGDRNFTRDLVEDVQALERSPAGFKLQIGAELTGGLGAAASGVLAKSVAAVIAGVIVTVSLIQMWGMFSGWRGPDVMQTVVRSLHPFHIVHRYHIFPTMQTERHELIIEGSDDAVSWHPYLFHYKPYELDRRPPVNIPHQPRLDWMMWFVPQQKKRDFFWFNGLLYRLKQNQPAR